MSVGYGMLLQDLFDADVALPAGGGAFGELPPGTTCKFNRHHESEIYVILSGSVDLICDQSRTPLTAGDVVVLEPFETHSLVNTSTDDPSRLISLYWEDPIAIEKAVKSWTPLAPERARIVCPPPTPDGPLHLGHLAGPYLRADVLRRWLVLQRKHASLVCGIDDNQNFVDVQAARAGVDPEEFALDVGNRIAAAFSAVDIPFDCFIRPHSTPSYATTVAQLFSELARRPFVTDRVVATAYCNRCSRSLYEAFAVGGCPHCGVETTGELCERCGAPNEAKDLVRACCNVCGTAADVREERALLLELDGQRDELLRYYDSARCGPRLRTFVRTLAQSPLAPYRLTRVGTRGIPVPVEGFDGSVVDPWIELFFGQYASEAAVAHARAAGDADAPLIQFFGFDNSYFYGVLYPILSVMSGDTAFVAQVMVTNEFLNLDGAKFSTSRQHAVWVDELVRDVASDAVRLAVLSCPLDISEADFRSTTAEALKDGTYMQPIVSWLDTFIGLQDEVDGLAPSPGTWLEHQESYFRLLHQRLESVHRCLALDTFDLAEYARLLFAFANDGLRFVAADEFLRGNANFLEERRAGLALSLVGAKAFAIASAPAMPRTAARLWASLGYQGAPHVEASLSFVPTRTPLSFSKDPYFNAGGSAFDERRR
jgi:methionyl-tRNA synthetase